MNYDMVYNGKKLTWGTKSYNATSGMKGFQKPENQCVQDNGPIPEGYYTAFINYRGLAKVADKERCTLSSAWGWETIPRGKEAGDCENYWANWGKNRLRLEPVDELTKSKCNSKRGGFYIHDSVKGYSHGCIEVSGQFFRDLEDYSKKSSKKTLILKVNYNKMTSTYGDTEEKNHD